MTYLYFAGWVFACWYATIPAFWLAIHPFAGYWRTWKRSPYLVLLPFWLLMVGAAMAITRPWYGVRLYETPWSWAPALALVIAAVSLYLGARGHISNQQVMGQPELAPGHTQKLIATGMHGRIRHPLYVGHLSMLLGWTVGMGWIALYWLTGFAVLSGWAMICLEERELEKRFGEEYREYKKRVPALVPRIVIPVRENKATHPSIQDGLMALFQNLQTSLPRGLASVETRPDDNDPNWVLIQLVPVNTKAARFGVHVSNQERIVDFFFGTGTTLELPAESRASLTSKPPTVFQEVEQLALAIIEGSCEERFWILGRTGIIRTGPGNNNHVYNITDVFTGSTLVPKRIRYAPFLDPNVTAGSGSDRPVETVR